MPVLLSRPRDPGANLSMLNYILILILSTTSPAFAQSQESRLHCSRIGEWGSRGETRDIVVAGSLALAADGRGLAAYDVSEPRMIRRVASYRTESESIRIASVAGKAALLSRESLDLFEVERSGAVRHLTREAARNYEHLAGAGELVAAAGSMLTVWRVTGETLLQIATTALPAVADSVLIHRDLIFVATLGEGVSIYRVESGELRAIALIPLTAVGLVVSGDNLYGAAGGRGFWVANISDPSSPRILSLTFSGEGDLREIAVSGTTLIASDNGTRLHLFDVSDPAAPRLVSSRDEPVSVLSADGGSLFAAGEYRDRFGLVTGTGTPIRVFDIQPAGLTLRGELTDRAGPVTGVASDGTYAYVADPPMLRVLDLRSNDPFEVASVMIGDTSDRIHLSNRRLLVYGRGNVHIVDVSAPIRPVYLGVFRSTGLPPSTAVFAGEYLLEANRASGFHVVDISDPANSRQVSGWVGQYFGMVAGRNAAYGVLGAGFRVFDLSTPTAIRLIRHVESGRIVDGEVIPAGQLHGERLLMLEAGGLRIFDVTDPLLPIERHFLPLNSPVDMSPDGSIVYVISTDGTLTRIDLTPLQPVVTHRESGLANPTQLSFVRGVISVADRYSLKTFRDLAQASPSVETVLKLSKRSLFSAVLEWTTSEAGRYEVETSASADFRNPLLVPTSAISGAFATREPLFVRVRAAGNCGSGPWSNVVALSPSDLASVHFVESGRHVVIRAGGPRVSVEIPLINRSSVSRVAGLFSDANGILAGPPRAFQPGETKTVAVIIDPAIFRSTASVTIRLSPPGQAGLLETSELRVTVIDPASSRERPRGHRILLPGVGSTPGARGTIWKSDVSLSCGGEQNCPVTLFYSSVGGVPGSFGLELAAHETLTLVDVVAQHFGQPATLGLIEVGTDPARGLRVNARTYNENSTGRFGQSIEGVALDSAGRGIVRSYALGIAHGETYRTNFGVIETTGVASSIDLRLHATDGRQLAVRRLNLGPYENWTGSLPQLFAGVADIREGYVAIDAASGVVTYASRIDQRTGDATFSYAWPVRRTRTAQSPGFVTKTMPAAGSTPGAQGSNFRTALQLLNPGSTPVQIDAILISVTGSRHTARSINLAPGQIFETADAIAELFPLLSTATAFSGSFRFTASAPFAGWGRIYNTGPGGTFGQYVPFLEHDPSNSEKRVGNIGLDAARVTLPAAHLPQIFPVAADGIQRTNVGIVEVAGEKSVVTLRIYDPLGNLAARKEVGLEAYQSVVLLGLLSELGLDGRRDLRIEVERSPDSNGSIVYASVVEQGSGDATFTIAK